MRTAITYIYYKIVHGVQTEKTDKRNKWEKKLVACNLINNTVNLLPWLNPEEENVNTPDCKSSNSANRLALPTSFRRYGTSKTLANGSRCKMQNDVNVLSIYGTDVVSFLNASESETFLNECRFSCRFWAWYSMSKNVVTLKSGSEVIQRHWKWYHSIDRVWFLISVL